MGISRCAAAVGCRGPVFEVPLSIFILRRQKRNLCLAAHGDDYGRWASRLFFVGCNPWVTITLNLYLNFAYCKTLTRRRTFSYG